MVRKQSTLIIWSLLIVYTLLTFLFTSVGATEAHYVSFVLVALAFAAQMLRQPACYLFTLLLLSIGFFTGSSITPTVVTLNFGALSVSPTYLLLIIYFLIINKGELAGWAAYVLKK